MNILRLFTASLLILLGTALAAGQDVAVKTNIIGDALLSPNAALEVGVAPKWSVETSLEVNFWTINDHKWRHWAVQPEVRYWLCQRYFGHFVGFHLLGGEYNVGGIKGFHHDILGLQLSRLGDTRFQGWFAGAGLAYGYTWILDRRWSLEAEIGLGYIYRRYDAYPCAHCGKKIESDKSRHYVGPTKAALNLIYVF